MARTLIPFSSVHRAAGHHAWIQFDLSERAFISCNILLQDAEQCFCLLRAQIDSLEILNFHLGFTLLHKCSEDQEEIPYVHADLYTVGIVLAIVVRVRQLHIGLYWVGHRDASVAGFAARKEVFRTLALSSRLACCAVQAPERPFGHNGRVPEDGCCCTPVLLLVAANRCGMLLQ